VKVDSMFSKGLFSQTLSLILVDQTVLTVNNTPSTVNKNSSNSSLSSNQNSNNEGRSASPPKQLYSNEGRNNLREITAGRIGLTTGAGADSRIPASMLGKSNTAEMVPVPARVINTGIDNTQTPARLDDAKLPKINPKTLLPIAGR
jgi:hypothetical protein